MWKIQKNTSMGKYDGQACLAIVFSHIVFLHGGRLKKSDCLPTNAVFKKNIPLEGSLSFCRGMIWHEGGRGNRNTTQILSMTLNSRMAERIHWWTKRWLRSPLFLSLSLSISFSDSWERVRCKHDVPKCGKLLIMKLRKYQQKQAQKPEAQKHKPKHSPDVCRCTQSARKSQKTFAQLLNQSGAIHVGWALWPSLVISQCMGCPSCKTAGRVLRIAWKWPCWSAPRCIADRLPVAIQGQWKLASHIRLPCPANNDFFESHLPQSQSIDPNASTRTLGPGVGRPPCHLPASNVSPEQSVYIVFQEDVHGRQEKKWWLGGTYLHDHAHEPTVAPKSCWPLGHAAMWVLQQ